MPKLNEVIKAQELGRRSGDKLVWVKCSSCGEGRWVYKHHISLQNHTGLCQKCNGSRPRRHAKMENHGMWNGGTRIDARGYIYLKLDARHPLFAMVTARDHYIAEHRLVMAQHLDRCLEPWEIVHHKNGNKHDNRIENLELLPSNRHHFAIEKIISETRQSTLKAVGEGLDIEFIINMLKQAQGSIWQKKGRNICKEQIRKLEALKRGEMPE